MQSAIAIAVAFASVLAAVWWYSKCDNAFALAALERGQRDKGARTALYNAGIIAFGCCWILISIKLPSGYTRVPFPATVADNLLRATIIGELVEAIGVSALRIAVGFGAAAALGTGIGLVAGTYAAAGRLVLPTAIFLRYIPSTVFVTLLVVYFGIGDLYKYSVIFVGVFFFILQMTVDAVRQVDRAYIEMALVSGVPRKRMLDQIILRATAPTILDVLRVNLSGAWTFLVLAEVVGAKGGLGHLVAIGQRFGRIESVYVAIFTFGVIGIVSDLALQACRRWLFRWSTLATRR